mgnify:CR=1 FL=1
MLAYGIIYFVRLRKEEKINDEEIDRDIIKRNYGKLFVQSISIRMVALPFNQ